MNVLPAAPTITAIVVTWNSSASVSHTLESIRAQRYSPGFVQTVVIDNASSDGTPALIRRNFPEVKLIAAGGNHGFARANNLAMRDCPADLFALVNPDAILHPDWLYAVVEAFHSTPEMGVLASKVFYSNRLLLQHTGGMVHPNALTYHLGDGEFDIGQYNEPYPVDYAIGAALVTRGDMAQRLGYLPEAYFMYYEETDYCFQVRRAGYQVLYQPRAVAYHDERHSYAYTGRRGKQFFERYHRSRYLFALRQFTTLEQRRAFIAAERVWLARSRLSLPDRWLLLRSKLSHWRKLMRNAWLLAA